MDIKIMSFNLRYDCEGDGINSFTNRIDNVVDTIKSENADIIGFQEATDSMRRRLRVLLPEYAFVGCGRDYNYHGEATVIAYKADLFEMIHCENIWLSETPTVAGTRYHGDHSGCCRMFTSILLKHDNIEKPFRMINTHLDHEGKNGRFLEATQLTDYIADIKEHFILTGDFNALPDAPEIKLITEKLANRSTIDCSADLEPTFHEFGKRVGDKRLKIDYIFTDGICKSSYLVKDFVKGGKYYSDHNAVCAYIEL